MTRLAPGTHGPARRACGQGRKAMPRESGGRAETPSSDEWQGSRRPALDWACRGGRGNDGDTTMLIRAIATLLLGLCCAAAATAAGTFVPAPARVDMVHDAQRNRV